jgi:hypothetical protein
MLESVSPAKTHLASRSAEYFLAAAATGPTADFFESAKFSFGQAARGGVLEFTCSPPGGFFAAIKRVTKHLCHGGISAQEMNLKTVGLFFRARSAIDAPNIWL